MRFPVKRGNVPHSWIWVELVWTPTKTGHKNRQGSKECGTEHKSVHHFGWWDMKRGDSAGLAAFRQLFSDVLGGRLRVFRLVMEMRKLIMINNSCKDGSSLPPVRLGSSQCDLPFREKEQKVSMQLEAAYQNKTGSGHFSLLSLPQDSRFALTHTNININNNNNKTKTGCK